MDFPRGARAWIAVAGWGNQVVGAAGGTGPRGQRRPGPAGRNADPDSRSNQAHDGAGHPLGKGRRILRDAGTRSFVDGNETQEPPTFVADRCGKRKGIQSRDIHPVGKPEVRCGLHEIMMVIAVLVRFSVGMPVGVMTMPWRRMVDGALFSVDAMTVLV